MEEFIVAKKDRVGKMRLFGEIDLQGHLLERFLAEFELLNNDDSIDTIEILINSQGGSTMHGFPIITAINNSPKTIITIVDTVAASMAGLIFLAGKIRKMHSYSQLMLHAARSLDGSKSDAVTNTNQNIYDLVKGVTKRAKDKINSWLAKDTWFNATQAIQNSLATEVIPSKMNLVSSYQNEVRLLVASGAYTETTNNNLKTKYSNMEVILNELELKAEASEMDVKVKIQEIKNALTLKTQELVNRDTKILEMQAKLDAVEAKAKAEQDKVVSDLIEEALKNRQITADAKPTWIAILQSNFENGSKAIQALAKIEKLSDIINTDDTTSKIAPVFKLDPIQELMMGNK